MERFNFKLGVPQRGYGVSKNIPADFIDKAVRPMDYYRFKSGIKWRFFGKSDSRDLFKFREPAIPKADVLHFFNTVAFTKTPWIVTYESLLPYFDSRRSEQEQCIEQLLGPSCKGIVAMSHHAKVNFRWKLSKIGMEGAWDFLENKITVLYPPEELRIGFQSTEKVQFLFVAREFYKKGGLAVLRSLFQLKFEHNFDNWTAVFVGDLGSLPDQTFQSLDQVYSETKQLMQDLSSNITHYSRMSQPQVISHMQKSHFLLHPTLQETYGYVIAEAMSCGCVPITCGIRAIPEFIDHCKSGFLLEVKTDSNGNPKRFMSQDMWQGIESQLCSILVRIAHGNGLNPFDELTGAARKHIELHHNPKLHRSKLLRLYHDALSE